MVDGLASSIYEILSGATLLKKRKFCIPPPTSKYSPLIVKGKYSSTKILKMIARFSSCEYIYTHDLCAAYSIEYRKERVQHHYECSGGSHIKVEIDEKFQNAAVEISP